MKIIQKQIQTREIIKKAHLNTTLTPWRVNLYWSGSKGKHVSVGSDTFWRPSIRSHFTPVSVKLHLFLPRGGISAVLPFVPLLPWVSNHGNTSFCRAFAPSDICCMSLPLKQHFWGHSLRCGGKKWSWVWLSAKKFVKTHVCCRQATKMCCFCVQCVKEQSSRHHFLNIFELYDFITVHVDSWFPYLKQRSLPLIHESAARECFLVLESLSSINKRKT